MYSRYLLRGFPATRAADAAHAFAVPIEFLTAPEPAGLDISTVNFRAGRKAQAVHRRAAIANGRILLGLDDWLKENFRIPKLNLPDLQGEDPTLAAEILREAWGMGTKPAQNMVQLCESKGIGVYGLSTVAEDVDAFSAWHNSLPLIFISRRKTPERSRFDIAHELGHLVLHHGGCCDAKAVQEKEADQFASAFLIPRSAMRQYLPKLPSLEHILEFKSVYHVSAMAVTVSLHRAGMLTDASYKRRCAVLNSRGYRSGEPEGIQQYEHSRIFEQVFDSQRPNPITRRQLADLLHLSPAVVREATLATPLQTI
ncbi:ImmA/IrrE family metallo-endopeptidase [Corynebacterium lizhenjunii]|uniref:ImmA/IrrE family metallo-endopeptidase n=1 Tax=Corynebacterium lizhenjunii TaxID=2709394 RepID=A0A7T0PAP9_9CORY|nr:ImmA/IrrE family metallo-endopeptidase [Corynebacterium lizhenjunii]QPK78585.1 ImmA/IrrE family metallo-endopeptidase [Corynebacterium lizhenjunii]